MLVLGGSLMAILVLPVYAALGADVLTPLTGRRNAVFIVAAGSFLATLVLGLLAVVVMVLVRREIVAVTN